MTPADKKAKREKRRLEQIELKAKRERELAEYKANKKAAAKEAAKKRESVAGKIRRAKKKAEADRAAVRAAKRDARRAEKAAEKAAVKAAKVNREISKAAEEAAVRAAKRSIIRAAKRSIVKAEKAIVKAQMVIVNATELAEKAIEDKKMNAERHREYRLKNIDNIREYQKEYKNENPDKIREYRKTYNEKNSDKIAADARDYYSENKDRMKAMTIENASAPAKHSTYNDRIVNTEELPTAMGGNGILIVHCKFCKREMVPTNAMVTGRLASLEGKKGGEQAFYCSDICKKLCPVYNKHKFAAYDKRSKKTARVSTDAEVRQMVLEREDHTCERCGRKKRLEVHHYEGATISPMMTNDLENLHVLCHKCHKKTTKMCGIKATRRPACKL